MSHTKPLPMLVEALRTAVRQNSHDMLMTGEELRACEAALEAYELGARSTAAQPVEPTEDLADHVKAYELLFKENARLRAAVEARAPAVTREVLVDLVQSRLTSIYTCNRVWHAWSVGTMTEDDFTPASETDLADEIADEVLALSAASGDSTPPSLEVHMDREHGGLAFGKGHPSGALRPEPEAVGQGRWWRKRPVVVEAFQWDGMEAGCQAAKARFPELDTTSKSGHLRQPEVTSWYIRTLEGQMRVSPGDWIVRGVAGEFYPCKPDIFAATYEPAEHPHAASGSRGD